MQAGTREERVRNQDRVNDTANGTAKNSKRAVCPRVTCSSSTLLLFYHGNHSQERRESEAQKEIMRLREAIASRESELREVLHVYWIEFVLLVIGSSCASQTR